MVSKLADFPAEFQKLTVWEKGRTIAGHDPAVWRHDDFSRMIRYSDHGDRNSPYGWEIDHILATRLGGSNDLSNLRPLHCINNASLGGLLGSALKR